MDELTQQLMEKHGCKGAHCGDVDLDRYFFGCAFLVFIFCMAVFSIFLTFRIVKTEKGNRAEYRLEWIGK